MRIFLSYGHDEHASLAERIKRDLSSYGHQTWFDLDRLKSGGDWERYIEDGLDWASSSPSEGRFVLLMTPHSVRRPDGYCLNELARAWSRHLPITPVMVTEVEPPLSICRIQYLDMRDCVPVDDHQERYKSKFGQLLSAIEDNRQDFEGAQARLRNYLDPLPYEAEISQHLLRFTGRDWVVRELERWLVDSKHRVFWITGEAGVGKSALAAWLSTHRPEIAAFHACRYGNSDRVNPKKALCSIAYQLSTQLEDYGQRLNASNLDALSGEVSVGAVFQRLFIDPLGGGLPPPERPVVVLLDALDEATEKGKNELASIIGTELGKTPPWLRWIVTSRPHENVVNFPLQALEPWKIDTGRAENTEDIRRYLRRELRVFVDGREPPHGTVERIIEKSEHLFLYASWVRQELADGRLELAEVEKFPQGLGGIYATFFQRYFPDLEQYSTMYRPVLEAICAAREPLAVDFLKDLFSWSAYLKNQITKAFGSLFPASGGCIRPFHQSISDWLSDENRAGAYFVSVEEGHRRLANYGWQQYQLGAGQMDRYSLTYLPAHLAGCGRKDELRELMLDFNWLEAKLRKTDVTALVSDYDSVRALSLPEKSLRLVQHALRVSAQVLARDKSQLAAQLLARIPEKEPLLKTTLERSLAIRQPWLRPLTASLAAEQSIRWLKPPGETLSDVAFSKDGRWAAHVSGTFGKEPRDVVLWDLKEWRSLGPHFRTLPRLNPFALALSNDARWCLYADSIGGVHRLGEAGEIWEGHAHRELTIALWLGISADGKRALSACQHGRLVAWDIDANRHEIVWDENDNYTQAMSLDATGTRAVVARANGSVALLELWPTCVRTLYTIDGEPTALAISLDNSVFAVATASGRVEVHLVETSETIGSFSIEEKPTALALSGDTRYVAVGTAKGTIDVWSIAVSRRTAQYSRGHTYEIKQIAFSHDGAHVISADSLHIKEWSIRGHGEQESVARASPATGQVKVTTDGLHTVAVLENGHLGVWNLRTGELESTLPHASGPSFGDTDIGPAERIALATQGPEVLAWNKKLLCVWNLTTGACVGTSKASEAGKQFWAVEIRDAAITSDGTGVVYLDGVDVSFWSPGEGNSRVLGTYDDDPPGYVAISPDGKFALSSGGDRQIHLWRLSGPPNPHLERIRTIKRELDQRRRELGQRLGQRSNNFDPDASYWPDSRDKPSRIVFVGPNEAIVTTGDGSLFVVDIHDEPSGRPRLEGVRIQGDHTSGVSVILAHPQRRLFVTSCYDGSVRVWDLGKRCSIAVLNVHPGTIQQLSASAERILLNTPDGVVNLVEVRDGALVAAFQGDKQFVSSDADAELRYVVALDQSGQMHFLRVEPDFTQTN